MAGIPGSPTPPPEVPDDSLATYFAAYNRELERQSEAVDVPHGVRAWWRRPIVLAAAVVPLAIAVLFGVRLLTATTEEPRNAGPRTVQPTPAARSPKPAPAAPRTSRGTSGVKAGATVATPVVEATARCEARPSVDSSGTAVTYEAANLVDGEQTTAWRCPGTALGERVELQLDGAVEIGSLGLVPGYAKTDPTSGTDRYAENNRILRLRWELDDGRTFEQSIDPAVDDRSLRVLRIPPTTSSTVTLVILAVDRGPRNTTAVSEVVVGAVER